MTRICTFLRQVPWTHHNSLKQMKRLSAVVLGHIWKPSLSEIQEKTHNGTNSYSTLLPEKSPQDEPWSSMQCIRKTRQLRGPFEGFSGRKKKLRESSMLQCAKNPAYFVLWESLKMETFQIFPTVFCFRAGIPDARRTRFEKTMLGLSLLSSTA